MLSVTSVGFPLFVALLVAVWYVLPPARRWWAMLAAGVVFYLSMDVPGFLVLTACSAAVWYCAQRPALFRPGLAAALAPLLLLKYYSMAAGTVNALAGLSLWEGAGLLQPLGISYFSLQLTGYLVDVRKGRIRPEPQFARVFCYASFFLSITQGPFNRYDRLMPQLSAPTAYDADRVWRGACRAAWGYFKKYAIAERAAVVVAEAFTKTASLDRSQLIFGTVLYSLQLYADFSGYTDIVLGAGEAMGLDLPENFRQPFLAANIRELWSRWHISLSRWFRDCVYIPLGGNRRGTARRDLNLVLTFLVSGLWHGANWTFVVWGGLHGLLQALENHLPWSGKITKWPARLVGIAGTFSIFVITFTIFRADSLAAALAYFAAILQNSGFRVFSHYWELGLTSRLELVMLLLGIVLLAAVDILHEAGVCLRDWVAARPVLVRGAVYEICLLAFLFLGRFLGGGGFLYARF